MVEIIDHLRPIEIGVTNRILTGTDAFTRRNAAVTSWSPLQTGIVRNADRGVPHSALTTPHWKWGPRSDSHRRIRVYETRPVAAEGTGAVGKAEGRMMKAEFRLHASAFQTGALTWICTTILRFRKAVCTSIYTLRANWHPWPDLHRLGPT